MFIRAKGSGCRRPKSIEDQVSANIRCEVQVSKSDLMAGGVAFDLLQMAKRVGPQCEAAEYEDLSGEEGFSLDHAITDDRRSHRTFRRRHSGTLNESTNVAAPVATVGVKTSGSRVGRPELCI